MRWPKNEILIPSEEIANKIIELKEKGISTDKFALAYARVSTKHGEQIGSKENQVLDCQKYAEKQGLNLIYVFECAESARKMGRKVFNAMIDTTLHYNIKHIIMKDTSRLARNIGDKYIINELIEGDKINIHFYLNNEILDSKSDLDFSDIKAVFDQRFSKLLSQKMKWAAKERKEKGTPYQLPAGYLFGKDSKGESDSSKIEIDKRYEHIIREMFDLYINKNYTLEMITKYFNSMNYLTRQNKPFYASTIHRMITNKAYTGKYFWDKGEWKRLSIPCPAYVTEEQYEEIQRIIKLNSRGSKKRRKKSYLLTGFVLCSSCDCFASGNRPPEEGIYYTHKCKNPGKYAKPHWREKTLLNTIHSEVEKVFYDEKYTEMLKTRLKKIVHAKSTVTQKKKKEIDQRIKKLERQQEVLLNDRLDETISKEIYKKKNTEIENELKVLNDRLSGLSVDLSKYYNDAEKIIDGIRNFTSLYKDAMNIERIKLLRDMANWIYYDGEKAIIEWKKPFDILLSTEENVINHPSIFYDAGDQILLLRVVDGA